MRRQHWQHPDIRLGFMAHRLHPFGAQPERGLTLTTEVTLDQPMTKGGRRGASRSDGVYVQLRRAIVQGQLRPKQRLVEAELAETLEVSRTPIREALQRLALDGLVSRHRRGWVVREHEADEIKDIYACRAALEGYAARLAAVAASDA